MRKRRGFTLIEILTVVAVFSVIMLIATNIFLYATRAQRRASDAQRTQGDIRFAMEAMAREVRYGAIDYSCYSDPLCTPDGTPPTLDPVADVLATIDANGKRVRFRTASIDGGPVRLYICVIEVPEESLDKCSTLTTVMPGNEIRTNWEAVTPVGVRVVRAKFFINPHVDPFALHEGPDPYASDEQPRVTMIIQTRQESEDIFPEQLSMQTTVTSHIYGR